jgi:hypothetical protein
MAAAAAAGAGAVAAAAAAARGPGPIRLGDHDLKYEPANKETKTLGRANGH